MIKLDINKAATLEGHQNPIFSAEQGANSSILYTAGNDKGVVQWNLDKMEFERIVFPVPTSVYKLFRIPNTDFLAVGERSGIVTVVDVTVGKVIAKLLHHKKPVFDIKMIGAKNELIISSEDGTVSVWSLKDYRLLYDFRVSAETVRNIAVSNDESIVVLGAKDGMVRVYDAFDFHLLKTFSAHTMPVTAMAFSPDGRYLLSGGRDAQLQVFDVADFSVAKSFTAHMFTIYAIKYHPKYPIFATASRDKSIKIWSSDDFRLLRIISNEKEFDSHLLSINDISWTMDGRRLMSVGDDKKVIVWNFDVV